MRQHDFALEFLRLAERDEYVVDKLIDDPLADDAIIGFHCQQAAEKLLKALLVEKAVRYKKVHDLVYLMNLVRGTGEQLPDLFNELKVLVPFAVEFRYAEVDPTLHLDRKRIRELIRQWRAWIEGRLLP